MELADKILLLPILLPVLIGSLVFHELAHAVTAHLFGDPTPRDQGRLTLNPIKHLDVWGSGVFLFTFLFTPIAFGWAKPVIIHPKNLPHPKRDMAVVAFAGPFTNFVIALLVAAAFVHGINPESLGSYLQNVALYTLQINVVLTVFNLLPVPPLDGSRIIGALMPDRMYEDWSKLDQYAPLFILALFFVFGDLVRIIISQGVELLYRLIALILGA